MASPWAVVLQENVLWCGLITVPLGISICSSVGLPGAAVLCHGAPWSISSSSSSLTLVFLLVSYFLFSPPLATQHLLPFLSSCFHSGTTSFAAGLSCGPQRLHCGAGRNQLSPTWGCPTPLPAEAAPAAPVPLPQPRHMQPTQTWKAECYSSLGNTANITKLDELGQWDGRWNLKLNMGSAMLER